jgi:hypothetical protein
VFKLRHDEGVKERSFYLCKIQSFYYKKYVQCREIKKSTDFLRNLPKSSELIYRNVTRWVWQHCLSTVTPGVWNISVEHTANEIIKRWRKEKIIDAQEVEPLRLSVNTGD